ncbi:MAG: hypothetical protein HGJ96_08955 [Desulfobacteraceae bacterium]|nr:hypothetical protein [Desulfobacteraceae bacterium]
MKSRFMQRIILSVFICVLSPFIMGMGVGGHSSGSGGGGFGAFVPLIILLIILLIPVIKAYNAAKEAEKFKTLVFVTTFYEYLGWILCFTIIGIPIGLVLVLASQLSNVLIKIEANTSGTLTLLKSRQENHD